MAERYAVVDENGVIVNVIVADADFDPGNGLTIIRSDTASPGETHINGVFLPPADAPAVDPE